MMELLDKLKRDIRRLRNDVGPFCSDEGINLLMDVHDELLRSVRKLEAAMRKALPEDGAGHATEDGAKRRSSMAQ
jgi:hypothetical protein